MGKYLKLIPLMIYPYLAILTGILLYASLGKESPKWIESILSIPFIFSIIKFLFENIIWCFLFFHLFLFALAILCAVLAVKSKNTPYQIAKMNLLLKATQIPAYIIYFALGVFSVFLSVWGIGILLAIILIDLLTIILTGINSIGCTIRLKKDTVISKRMAIILGICSFLYCVDIVVAIIYVVLSKKHERMGIEKYRLDNNLNYKI